jgi:hypothetical protein
MEDRYIKAISYESFHKNILSRISDLFVRQPDTDYGLGAHYIVDLVGEGIGGAQVVTIVCKNNEIPVLDMRNQREAPIRDIVKQILEKAPSRCAIILDTRDNTLIQKVRTRIANAQCDLRFRRVVFCLADQEPSSGNCIQIPGSTEDKMVMLLYHVPDRIQKEAESPECFRPLAEAMVDYTLFEPRVWIDVSVSGTLGDFLSTAKYQIARRVCSDPNVADNYPSFERNWRRSMATRLKGTLLTPPVALCPSIHRVIPIGVSSSDAMQAMVVAIPKDIKDPYAITVQLSAVDEQCGSIAITQPMQYTVVNVHCVINPGIQMDVIRELREGHKAVVQVVHQMSMQFITLQKEMALMKTQLAKQDSDGEGLAEPEVECSKQGCTRTVTKRFRSGKRRKQCSDCISYVAEPVIAGKKEQGELEHIA